MISRETLKSYEIIFLVFELAYVLVFMLNYIEFFMHLPFIEVVYGYGFFILLGMFVAWAILLKLSGARDFSNIEVIIFFLLVVPVVDRLVLLLGGLSLILIGARWMMVLFFVLLCLGLFLFSLRAIKGFKNNKKFKLNILDLLLIIFAVVVVVFFFVYHLFFA